MVPDRLPGVKNFSAADGTRLAYHRTGEGDPLICLPGGPMQASAYLGDLGGLPALLRLDLRGTGESAVPADLATYRVDRQVDDVEALRVHLGLETIDLLGHSAGGTLAMLYAARYPDRVGRLVLVAPSPRVVGIEVADEDRREVAELRAEEPWFPDAYAAFLRIWAGEPTDADWAGIAPFSYRRWDAASQANVAREATDINMTAAAAYYGEGAFDPHAVRSALSAIQADVLLVAGEYDVGLPPKRAAEYADLLPGAELVVQPGSGHFPWLDDPEWFARMTGGALRR